MFGTQPVRTPQDIVFLLVPNFSMMAFTSSVEPLRAANRESGRELYRWSTVTADGAKVIASNGIELVPAGSLADVAAPDTLFVCAGVRVSAFQDGRVFSRLRELARAGVPLGGLCTGTLVLARAGLLDGYRCTIHWENVEAFAELFPSLDITATLYELDRNRYTCSGGTAPLDMMINSIARDHDDELAVRVAEQLLHTFVRQPHDTQRMSVQYRTGISHPKLLAAIAHMEAYLETPLSVAELAAAVGLSARQLERLFHDQLQTKPARYYLELRLRRARLLLRQTSMPILQIAVASGFSSASHFARCYRKQFGHSPTLERSPLARIPAAG